MFQAIKELFSLLSPSQRRRFYRLQVLVVLMAFLELVGIASIGPFMALVADINLLETSTVYKTLYEFSGITDPMDFLFAVGVVVLIMLAIASVTSIATTWRMSMFGFSVGTQIADRLYRHYLRQNWLFHAEGSSAQLTKQVATEALRVTNSVINPLMQLNARLVLALFISVAIFVYNPIVAISGLALFAGGYAIIYRVIRRRLVRFGREISLTNTQRFRLMNEGFGGIKDILLLNRQQNFIDQFNTTGKILANAQGKNQAFGQAPRYFMELLAFGAMISLVLVLLSIHHGVLSQVLPVLAVYALAGFKLLPALQQTYTSITQIKGNIASFEAIKPDLIASLHDADEDSLGGLSDVNTPFDETDLIVAAKAQAGNTEHSQHGAKQAKDEAINGVQNKDRKTKDEPSKDALIEGDIELKNIYFSYPGKHQPTLKNLNLTVPKNSTIGLVGASGSGKSTAIDLLLALIDPEQGELRIGDTVITADNKALWQKQIGFVPQSIFLSEGSIAENIAFGLSAEQMDWDKIKQAATLAHLDELIQSLPDGLNTKVGERGVQLSGGQRQRVGIARALYNQASVLVFDEATSALDGITENAIMTAIHELAGQKTIILIAHRLKTVQQCDIIYMMEGGTVVDQGTYTELLDKNTRFKRMAQHA